MNGALGAGVLLTCLATSAVWSRPQPAQDVTVTIRLVNGKNGNPVTDENLNVWVNSEKDPQLFRPDRNGIIKLRVGNNDVLAFASNIQVTCHPYSKDERSFRRYDVSEILAHGISDENLCSKKIRVEARPGEFVFYERPRTLLEWWRL